MTESRWKLAADYSRYALVSFCLAAAVKLLPKDGSIGIFLRLYEISQLLHAEADRLDMQRDLKWGGNG